MAAGTRRIGVIGLAAALAWVAPSGLTFAQTEAQTKPAPKPTGTAQSGTTQPLGSVRLPRQAMADGETLAAGTYNLRLASGPVPGAVGQTADESKWIEFVQGSQVRAKTLAVVLAPEEVQKIADAGTSIPAPGTSKVQVLKGEDYLRVWVNRANTHYLMHLALK